MPGSGRSSALLSWGRVGAKRTEGQGQVHNQRMTDSIELATRFVAAVAAKDFDAMAACYAPDIRVWHSTDRAWQSGKENLATARQTLSAIERFHYGDPCITATASGFVLQASRRGRAGANELDVPVCLVATVRDGKITKAEEYIDQGHFPRG